MPKSVVFAYMMVLGALIPNLSKASTECSLVSLDQQGISAIVQLVRNPHCDIRSVDDVLAQLPVSMRSTFTLFYRSQSLQGPHATDFQNPRAILTNADFGKASSKQIYLSFNGNPSQAGYKNLEILEIDLKRPPEDIFRYFDLEFPEKANSSNYSWNEIQRGIKISGPNPARCVACHGSPTRPIFPTYPNWSGAYNSRHMEVNPTEVKQLESLIKNSANLPGSRYRHLIWKPKDTFGSEGLIGNSRTNYFNSQLAGANMARIAKLIQRDPEYRLYRPAILASTMSCENFEGFFPKQIKSQLDYNILNLHNLVNRYPSNKQNLIRKKFYDQGQLQFGDGYQTSQENPWRNWTAMNLLWFDTLSAQGIDKGDKYVASIRYLFEGRGWDLTTWFIDLRKNTYSMSDGGDWSNGLTIALFNSDPELSDIRTKLFETSTYFHNSPDNPRIQQVCNELQQSSIALLSKAAPISAIHSNRRQIHDQDTKLPSTFSNTCTSCHTQTNIGPYIPFNDAEKFRVWAKTGRNKDLLIYRLNTSDDFARMPLNKNLNPDELADLMSYIQSL